MAAATDKRSERTQARLTDAHLLRLGELADQDHARFTRPARDGGNLSAWKNRRVAVVLAQGAARHYLHPRSGHGVKDLDVWTFYAARPSTPLRAGRYETHADGACLTAGARLESAFNNYATTVRDWNDCIYDLYCDVDDDILTGMQTRWAKAATLISRAETLLDSMDPDSAAYDSGAVGDNA